MASGSNTPGTRGINVLSKGWVVVVLAKARPLLSEFCTACRRRLLARHDRPGAHAQLQWIACHRFCHRWWLSQQHRCYKHHQGKQSDLVGHQGGSVLANTGQVLRDLVGCGLGVSASIIASSIYRGKLGRALQKSNYFWGRNGSES